MLRLLSSLMSWMLLPQKGKRSVCFCLLCPDGCVSRPICSSVCQQAVSENNRWILVKVFGMSGLLDKEQIVCLIFLGDICNLMLFECIKLGRDAGYICQCGICVWNNCWCHFGSYIVGEMHCVVHPAVEVCTLVRGEYCLVLPYILIFWAVWQSVDWGSLTSLNHHF